MLTILEQSRQKFAVSFKDETYALFVPGSVRYRLDDITIPEQPTVVLDWQTIPPDTSVEITIPSSANSILNDRNPYETRVLTIQSDYGTDSQLSQDLSYRVRNMPGFQ
jgi:hypothetical protein